MRCGGSIGTYHLYAVTSLSTSVLDNVCMRRRTVLALEFIAQKKADTQLTGQNKQAMALTHGFAHGVVQSVLFTIRYVPACCDYSGVCTKCACSPMSVCSSIFVGSVFLFSVGICFLCVKLG